MAPHRAKRGFTYPGTLWCGAGNNAESYEQLGEFQETDRCCREHDQCQQVIHPFTIGYGHHNFRWHTISHCDCDTRCKSYGPVPQAVLHDPVLYEFGGAITNGLPHTSPPPPGSATTLGLRLPPAQPEAWGAKGTRKGKKEKRRKKKGLLLTHPPGPEPQLGTEAGKSSVPTSKEGTALDWSSQDNSFNDILQDEPEAEEPAEPTPRETEVKAPGRPKKGRKGH